MLTTTSGFWRDCASRAGGEIVADIPVEGCTRDGSDAEDGPTVSDPDGRSQQQVCGCDDAG